ANSLFAFTTLALLPRYRDADARRSGTIPESVSHAAEGLALARDTLRSFPIDRVFRPVMNSLRTDIEINEFSRARGRLHSRKPLPIQLRPLDNEYVWKGNPYELDGWLKPSITSMQFSCDDPQVAWFSDSAGRAWLTLDGGKSWRNLNNGIMGGGIKNL